MQQVEERFRSLFEQVPVSLWENDFSAVLASLRELSSAGVDDFDRYFSDHPEEVFRLAAQVRNLDVNKRTLQLFEAPSKKSLRAGLGRIFGPFSYGVFRQFLIALADGARQYETETVLYTLKGAPRNVVLRIHVPPGFEDTLDRVLMSTLDISARKRAEDRIRGSRARALALARITRAVEEAEPDLPAMLAAVTTGLSEFSGDTFTISLENGAAAEAPGTAGPHEQGNGDGRVHTIELRTRGAVFGRLTAARSTHRQPFTTAERDFLQEVGDRVALSLVNTRLYVDTQQLNAELEDRVKRRTAQLEAINRELEAFTYSVSHDLRGPLRHMIGYVELLQRHTGDTLDEKGSRYLDVVSSAAARMGDLIDDLLAFSRMGNAEMLVSLIDFDGLVQGIIAELQSEPRLEWKIEALPPVYGDRAMLRQVWVNLLSNAIKYSRPRDPARIEIGCHPDADETVFFVRDNGVGFNMKYADKLFGIFQRLHRLEDFEGTGIGLANVQRIVQRHGGRVWAAAEENAGATFYFSLPNRPRKASGDA